MSAPLRVVVVDDSVLIRAGITRILVGAGIEVVAELADAEDVIAKVDHLRPDVVVLDVRMPPTRTDEGVRAARAIRQQYPLTGVLIVSAFAEPDYVQDLLGDGTDGLGYLLKERVADVDDFVASVRIVAGGGTVLDPAVVALLIREPAGRPAGIGIAEGATADAAMDDLMLEHAKAWAREHRCGVARELRDGFVAVTRDGRHARHAHFYLALEWLEAQGAEREHDI
jgi:DNA-binding NarL/FixJ family response regulator